MQMELEMANESEGAVGLVMFRFAGFLALYLPRIVLALHVHCSVPYVVVWR